MENMIVRLRNSSLFLAYILFRTSFILLASDATTKSTLGLTNETDRQALLAIKDQILEDPFEVFSSWNDSIHFCYWQGVTCNLRHQRVTLLYLPSLRLVGSLSTHIGNLTFLESIHLENNSFHGTIPQEIGRLFRLQTLSLYSNSFQGEFPTNLSYCSEIIYISIAQNNLGGKIPTNLGSLSNLLELYLSNNNFTGLIPPSLGNLSSLRSLTINYNNLEGNIPFELGQLSNLESLELAVNNLSGLVPQPLFNISSMSICSLPVNKLHGNLPPDMGLTLPNLQKFYVGENKFSGPFPPSIANASGLVIFDIGLNSFTGPVPINLGSFPNLQLLNLGTNSLGTNKPGDLNFLNSLTNCTNLRILLLSMNGFGGVLPNSIVNLSTKLTLLGLDRNYISGSIPQEIGNLVNLVTLGIDENMLSGIIPGSIGRLYSLQGLYLYENNITGEIPLSIGNITQLSVLSLGINMLNGSIPITLGNCTSLQALDLQSNRLTGVIPEQIMGLSSLTTALYLQQNILTGPLPSQVGILKNLGKLDFSTNKLIGEIPSTLGDCIMLEFLYMHSNNFEGSIPSSFEQLKAVQVLDVSHNNLSGPIPSFLGELPYIQGLNLSSNMFEGQVPDNGVFSNISAFSVVGNPKLCGGIQALQLPDCPTKVPEKDNKPFNRSLIPLVIILPLILLLACLFVIFYRVKRSSHVQQTSNSSLLQNEYPKLSYVELHQATNGFSSTNLIGEGRYGSVYKAKLNSQQTVAVKVLNLQQRGGERSFLAECETLRNIRHRNLIKIITICSSIDFKGCDFKALVFEYMPNGSLDHWLHPTSSEEHNRKCLNLLQRLNIAIDVASALVYLHHHCETSITHCDIKPSNILLGDELCAHVGDFGLAKFHLATTGPSNHPQMSSIGIRGTVGYAAPEYGMGGEVSTQGDVYSYGILILEMFIGKGPTNSMFIDSCSLHNYVKNNLPNQVMEIVDPQIILEEKDALNKTQTNSKGYISEMEVCLASILRVGIFCSAYLPRLRMDIRVALMELDKIRNVFLAVCREESDTEVEKL